MEILVFLLCLGAAVGALIWFLRRGGKPSADAATPRSKSATSASAVVPAPPTAARKSSSEPKMGRMLKPGERCCKRAKILASRWLEESHLTVLPLPGCAMGPACNCRWERVPDRRKGDRRKNTDRRGNLRFEDKNNRRKNTDRRKDSNDIWRNQ